MSDLPRRGVDLSPTMISRLSALLHMWRGRESTSRSFILVQCPSYQRTPFEVRKGQGNKLTLTQTERERQRERESEKHRETERERERERELDRERERERE